MILACHVCGGMEPGILALAGVAYCAAASAVGLHLRRTRKIPDGETAERLGGELICRSCRLDVFNGCACYHGEWLCRDCHEWTYPFHYDFEDGCQTCGSKDVVRPGSKKGRGGTTGGGRVSGRFWMNLGILKAKWTFLSITGSWILFGRDLKESISRNRIRKAIRGRRSNPKPKICSNCLDIRRGRDWLHTYRSDGRDDVEPIDQCWKCGEEDSDMMDFDVGLRIFLGTRKNTEHERGA